MQHNVFMSKEGHAEVTTPERHAHASLPKLMAVQKLDVIIAIVSSPSPRCLIPKAGSHVAVECSRPLAKKQSVQMASCTSGERMGSTWIIALACRGKASLSGQDGTYHDDDVPRQRLGAWITEVEEAGGDGTHPLVLAGCCRCHCRSLTAVHRRCLVGTVWLAAVPALTTAGCAALVCGDDGERDSFGVGLGCRRCWWR